MHAIETYLKSLSEIRQTGGATAETSYYAALETLLNEVGAKLKPKVRAVAQIANIGAGHPDFGLYTASQIQRTNEQSPIKRVLPERGVVEVKAWSDDSFLTAEKQQVSKYWKNYGLVLVTNYRDFVLIGRDASGEAVLLETYRIAESEQAFHQLLAHPQKAANEQGDRLLDFIRRVLLCEALLSAPEDLAWFLASYAREARHRVEIAHDLPALASLKKGLEDALGMTFEGEKGEHFFQATLVQTLFYGVFSSWVLWCRDNTGSRFDWHNAAWTLHVPMVKSLFDQIATPSKLKPLGVAEVLDWVGAALNRVDRTAFFSKFEEEHAVQYFYEPFLKAYDPELRKELGVWYTPPEIVQYQVERVDTVLREELGIPDGLADDNVVILDPCCGTGAYLVETIKRIHKTLEEKGGSALTAQKLKKAAIERVFGFEILPAPFVVAHLQLGLMLRQLGAPLDHNSDQRVGVYLTNALTGWDPLKEPKDQLPLFPELMEERDAANKVKQEAPILVILGNPPYNAFAGTSPREEGGLVEPYKEGLTTAISKGGWGIKKFNLDDLYVRFFRIAERRIAKSGKGVVCFISNFSYLGDPSFVVMRKKFLAEFDELYFDCLNGDSRETGKRTPEGKPDPSVFSFGQSKVGIRVGTAIGLMLRKENRAKTPTIRFQDLWGSTKGRDLLTSLKSRNIKRSYKVAKPNAENRYSFRPETVSKQYLKWPTLIDLSSGQNFAGMAEDRGKALISIDKTVLENRMRMYFNPSVEWEKLMALETGLTKNVPRFNAKDARKKIIASEKFDVTRLQKFAMRPFDTQWCYYVPIRPLWREPRPEYWRTRVAGEFCLVSRLKAAKQPEGSPITVSTSLCDYHMMPPNATVFPIRLQYNIKIPRDILYGQCVFEEATPYNTARANLSETSRQYLTKLGIDHPDADVETAGLIWMHALAIGYSKAYLEENADGIRQDWPRIPLPATNEALLHSSNLGCRIAALLDTEKPVEGVTVGKLDPRLKNLGLMQKVGGGTLNITAGELDVTAGWGHSGARDACMPGRGKVVERKLKTDKKNDLLGDKTLDIYLNDTAYWADVPQAVWDFTIGGYQVIKKWLSYREKAMLGRGITMAEAEHVTDMVRRIAALILLQPELDKNYQSVQADTWPWPTE